MVAVATYLGKPRPLMTPLVGRYFGRKGAQLDAHGANLAAAPLPGYGWRVLLGTLQHLVTDMMGVCGIFSEKKAANFLVDKVGDPYALA